MKIVIEDSYEKMSAAAAKGVVEIITENNDALICPASGDTPSGLFNDLVNRAKKGEFNPHKLFFVGLDEWMGMNGGDEGSCREYLDRQLFHPLNIKEDHISFFDGRSPDPNEECDKTDNFINDHGGIDLCILGLGMNGHIGMNEPGVSHLHLSHIAEISEETASIGQKYFSNNRNLEKGLTLGIASILASKHIFLLVSGEKKSAAVKKLLESEISSDFPASFLKTHPSCVIYLDTEAAKLVTHNE